MRHRIKGFKIGRTAAHRKATLAELSNALIAHKRITTTLTKAKALRMFVEPILHRAKDDTTHNRRQVFRRLRSKESVNTLFDEVGEKVKEREGGYTRVIRLGQRQGDGAEMAVIELVDYNDIKPDGARTKKKTRRTRRGSRKTTAKAPKVEAAAAAAEVAGEEAEADEEVEAEAEVGDAGTDAEEVVDADDVAETAEEPAEEKVEEVVEEVVETPAAEEEPVEETAEPEVAAEEKSEEKGQKDEEKKEA